MGFVGLWQFVKKAKITSWLMPVYMIYNLFFLQISDTNCQLQDNHIPTVNLHNYYVVYAQHS